MVTQIKVTLKLLTLAALMSGCSSPNSPQDIATNLIGCWQHKIGQGTVSEIWDKLEDNTYLIKQISMAAPVSELGPITRLTFTGQALNGGQDVAMTNKTTGEIEKRAIRFKDGSIYFDGMKQTRCGSV